MTTTAIGLFILILSLCGGVALARFLINFYYPQLTPIKCLSWLMSGMRIDSEALKVILVKQPMETFLAKNWRTLLFVVAVLFAFLIWPTMYKDLPMRGSYLQRQNRITGEVQRYMPGVSIDWL